MKKLDIVGQRFGRLLVIKEAGRDKNGRVLFECLCDCGGHKITRGYSLHNGDCRSCGCLRKELSSERNSTHGHSQEKLFGVWRGMLRRCYDPKHVAYEQYHGRGIEVCKEWRESYEAFKEFMLAHGYDVEYGLSYENTIDRINNDLGYYPENCRVVSMRIQSLNKTNNHYITYKLKKTTVTEAAEMNGLTNHQVFNRLNKGWDMKRALETPLKRSKLYVVGKEALCIDEWSQKTGIPKEVLKEKLKTQSMRKIWEECNRNNSSVKDKGYTNNA